MLMLMSLLWLLSTSLLHADVIRFRDEPWFRKSHALSYHDLKGRTRSGLDKRAKSAYSAVVPPPLDILRTVKESSVIEKVEHLESVGQKLVEENAPLDYESLNEFQIYFFVLSLAHIGAAFTTFLVIRRQFRILHEYVTLMCFYCTKASLWRLAPKLESTDLSRLFVAANLNFDCLPPLEDPLDVAAVNEKILSHSGPRVLTKEEDGGYLVLGTQISTGAACLACIETSVRISECLSVRSATTLRPPNRRSPSLHASTQTGIGCNC